MPVANDQGTKRSAPPPASSTQVHVFCGILRESTAEVAVVGNSPAGRPIFVTWTDFLFFPAAQFVTENLIIFNCMDIVDRVIIELNSIKL